MKHTLQDMMRQATRLTVAGRLNEATKAIQHALSGAASANAVPCDPPAREGSTPNAEMGMATPEVLLPIPEGLAFEMRARAPGAATEGAAASAGWLQAHKLLARKPHAQPRFTQIDDADVDVADLGDFTAGTTRMHP